MLQSSDQLPLKRRGHMDTLLCRTCGCSLVRLGISAGAATVHEHRVEHYPFCCPACVDVFITDPVRYLEETSDLIVCPTCLAEKPIARAMAVNVDGHEIHFCHCPRCVELFQANPDFYLRRLAGSISTDGVHDHNGCCLRPEDG